MSETHVTFFVADFYSADGASDVGRLQTDQVFRLKDSEGFLLNFTFGKANLTGLLRPSPFLRIPNVPVCPVFWVESLYCGL